MTTQESFIIRSLMFIGLLFGWGVRLYFQKQAKKNQIVKSVNTEKESLIVKLGYLIFLLPYIYIFTDWLNVMNGDFPLGIRAIGVVLLFGGNFIIFLAHKYLGKNWSGALDIQSNHTLITNGIYQYIRHPMYLGFLFVVIGVFLMSANWLLGILMFIWYAFMYFGRVNHEEQMMIDEFGDTYQAYMKRTGRIFPKF